MRKWISKDDPRLAREGTEPKPIRIEKKMVHGKMVEVKIYEAAYVPFEGNEAGSNEAENPKNVYQLFGDSLSPVWTGDKSFNLDP